VPSRIAMTKSRSSASTPKSSSRSASNGDRTNAQNGASDHLPDLTEPKYYFNRELSWIEFNRRVLHEALDDRTPLLERLKFTAIFSNNLDEFFMVRVAGLKRQVEANVSKLTPDGRTPQQQLEDISDRLWPIVQEQHHHFQQILLPLLEFHGVHLVDYVDLNQEQRTFLHGYFKEQIFPVLTPLAVDPGHPFPYISNLSLNLAVVLKDEEKDTELFARVKVPKKVLPRFLPLPTHLWNKDNPDQPTIWMGVVLEQVIAHNLEYLFPGMQIQEYYPFRVTRDADLTVAEDEADDLMMAIEQELQKRRLGGSVVRLEVVASMPEALRETLMHELELSEKDVYTVDGYLALEDLMSFMSLPLPQLKDPSWSSVVHPRLAHLKEVGNLEEEEDADALFAVIRHQDLLLHHPYHSFTASVQRFITQAAHDPDVVAIKMTLYRTSGDSPIIHALIDAAENGKQVVVLVELKARFDEENNILWARKLERAGVHVVYGLVGLKTHTKVTLVVRREADHMRRYVHIGTGNYNPKTAKLYTDLGLISSRDELGADLSDLFNFLTGYSRQKNYRKLLIAPVNLRDRMMELICRETEHCRQGQEGRIVAKMNSLVDSRIIQALYEASRAGVKIDLIVRGICCLRPQVPNVSENIQVISIIGRYLEHSRIFYFYNNGQEEIWIGSADWMPRNLDRRVEAVTPIEDPALGKDLQEILGVMLSDNRQAWELQADGEYVQRRPDPRREAHGSQSVLMNLALKSANGS
jgi:polyphosphate kinase